MAKLKPEFEKRGVKVAGLSVDSLDRHTMWAKDIEGTHAEQQSDGTHRVCRRPRRCLERRSENDLPEWLEGAEAVHPHRAAAWNRRDERVSVAGDSPRRTYG
jgi:hypothetical protein